MDSAKPDIQAIFDEAIALETCEQRAQHLHQVCGDDLQLRARVEALLQAHSQAGDFFGGKLAETIATETHPVSEPTSRDTGERHCVLP